MTRYARLAIAVMTFGGLAWTQAGAAGQPPAAESVPVVVELFTSEGCSSCPPADQLLMDLMKRQPVQGAFVIGLSEHVDYWNQLGWTDPFSNAAFSKRQTEYASRLGTDDVYTPQMVVDGITALVGSDRSAAIAAITRAAATHKPAVRLRWIEASPRTLDVTLDASPATADATLLLAVVEDGLQSAVVRGENAGRRLSHSGVTRRLLTIGKADHTGAGHVTPSVTIDPSWKTPSLRVVVLVQRRGSTSLVTAGTIGLS